MKNPHYFYAKAAAGYRRAAAQGDPRGQLNLGLMYENGQGVPKNYAEAFRWYSRGAEQDHGESHFRLALLYANGMGVKRNRVESYKHMILALNQGLDPAQKVMDRLEQKMTPEEIREARDLAQDWKPGKKN